jgi:hypothetical protein
VPYEPIQARSVPRQTEWIQYESSGVNFGQRHLYSTLARHKARPLAVSDELGSGQ